jgi:hypothetical protein
MGENFNKLVHNPKFWIAIVTGAVIALKTMVPTLPIDEATLSTLFLGAIFAIFGITAIEANAKIQAKTILDMQKLHQEDMKVLYAKFVK